MATCIPAKAGISRPDRLLVRRRLLSVLAGLLVIALGVAWTLKRKNA